jgi:hypothetical protein
MIAKGLLFEDQQGHEYLLSMESSRHNGLPQISFSRRIGGQWTVLDTKRSKTIRAGLMAAFLDFFSGICALVLRFLPFLCFGSPSSHTTVAWL